MGNVHPVTVKEVLSRPHSVRAILSTYDGLGTDLTGEGQMGGTYIRFYPGDEGATLLNLHGRRTASRLVIDGSSQLLLDDHVPQDSEIQEKIDQLYKSTAFQTAVLKDGGLRGSLDSPKALGGSSSRTYVGSSQCKTCHQPQYAQWQSTPHASALKTLIQRRRQHNPGCVRCHVVGFGEASGFTLTARQSDYSSVGCENCHGPGGAHIRNPRQPGTLAEVTLETCAICHTSDHSVLPEKPAVYWKRILHKRPRGIAAEKSL